MHSLQHVNLHALHGTGRHRAPRARDGRAVPRAVARLPRMMCARLFCHATYPRPTGSGDGSRNGFACAGCYGTRESRGRADFCLRRGCNSPRSPARQRVKISFRITRWSRFGGTRRAVCSRDAHGSGGAAQASHESDDEDDGSPGSPTAASLSPCKALSLSKGPFPPPLVVRMTCECRTQVLSGRAAAPSLDARLCARRILREFEPRVARV